MRKQTEKQKIKEVLDKIGIKYRVKDTTENLREILKKAKSDVEYCVEFHERHKNSYFWSPPQNAAGRRNEESRKSFVKTIGNFQFQSSVSCSCKNYYYTGLFFEGSERKDLRCFRKIQKMMEI